MNYQNKHLKEIVVKEGIFGGYSFRGKVENEKDGNVFVVQMKDLSNYYSKIEDTLMQIKGERIKNKYYLQKEDILFIAKGANNYALVYDLDFPAVVASSAFFVIRINRVIANPYFVAWYINQRKVQQFLKENMAGTYIPNININTVKEMKIRIPLLEEQNRIVKLNQLMQREQEIISTVKDKRQILLKTILCNQLK
jgi:restriction endonuclease S subunit